MLTVNSSLQLIFQHLSDEGAEVRPVPDHERWAQLENVGKKCAISIFHAVRRSPILSLAASVGRPRRVKELKCVKMTSRQR